MSWTSAQRLAFRMVVESSGTYPPGASNADLMALADRGLVRLHWTPWRYTPPEMMHIKGAAPTKKGIAEYEHLGLSTFRTTEERRASFTITRDGGEL